MQVLLTGPGSLTLTYSALPPAAGTWNMPVVQTLEDRGHAGIALRKLRLGTMLGMGEQDKARAQGRKPIGHSDSSGSVG